MSKKIKNKKAIKQPKTAKKRLVTREKQLKIDHKKSTFIMVIFVVIFLIIFAIALLWTARIQFTHKFDGVDLEEYAENIYVQRQTVEANRGNILDANGDPLAVNVKTYDLILVLNNGEDDGVMSDEDKTNISEILISNLELEDDEEASDLINSQLETENKDGYTQVEIGIYGKSISIEQKEAIEAAAKEKDCESAFSFSENVERFYPYGDFASYVLGFYMRDSEDNDQPQIGVEKSLQGYLQGRNGETQYLSDNNNIPINEDQSSVMEKVDGSNVTLTLDSQIQSYIQTFQDEYLVGLDEEMAFTVVMDANNGGILGAYATPSFDPNYRDVQNYVNPFTEFCFEPGSTIKSFVLAAAMEEDKWYPSNTAQSGIRKESEWGEDSYVADWLYNEYSGLTWGSITWEQGYWYSANTIMTYIEDAIGDDVWLSYLTETFKFGQSVNSQLMNTSACTVNPQYPLDYANTSFGQGMTVNSLQLLRAYSSIANDGVMVEPHIVEKMVDTETNEAFYTAESDTTLESEEVISEETASEMLKQMEQAVYYDSEEHPETTIYDAVAYPFGEGETRIGAKTGTAQVASGGDGYAEDGDLIYSVMALAPIDDPEILVYTAIISPNDSGTQEMADYVTKIIDYSLNHLNESTKSVDTSEIDNNRYQLANYVGEDVTEVEAQLKEDDINVISLGEGKIASQYPVSQVISQDDTVILRAVGDIDYTVLEGTSYNEADGICQVMNWECTFNGNGDVKKVEQERDTKYTLTLAVPDKLQIEDETEDTEAEDETEDTEAEDATEDTEAEDETEENDKEESND